MKIGLSALMLVALMSASSYGDFTWFNTATNKVYYNGGVQALVGSQSSSSIGCFAQLIWAGTDNAISDAIASGTGVAGDDVVVATTWIGANIFGGPAGRYSGGTFTADMTGSNNFYYVRFWTAPAASYAAGTIPVSTTNFYGDTALWANPGTQPPGTADSFNNIPNLGGGVGLICNKSIPEPAVFGLGVIGLISLRLFARKRK